MHLHHRYILRVAATLLVAISSVRSSPAGQPELEVVNLTLVRSEDPIAFSKALSDESLQLHEEIGILIQVLNNRDKDRGMRMHAADMLGFLRATEATWPLLRHLTDFHGIFSPARYRYSTIGRYSCAIALADIGSIAVPDIIEYLTELGRLNEESVSVIAALLTDMIGVDSARTKLQLAEAKQPIERQTRIDQVLAALASSSPVRGK